MEDALRRRLEISDRLYRAQENEVALLKGINTKLETQVATLREKSDKNHDLAERVIAKYAELKQTVSKIRQAESELLERFDMALNVIRALRRELRTKLPADRQRVIYVVSPDHAVSQKLLDYFQRAALGLKGINFTELYVEFKVVSPEALLRVPARPYLGVSAIFCVPTATEYWAPAFKPLKEAYKRARVLFSHVYVAVLSAARPPEQPPSTRYKSDSMVTFTQATKQKLTITADFVFATDPSFRVVTSGYNDVASLDMAKRIQADKEESI